MKSFLISIHPKWVIKIFNGDKTAEIRRTAPKDWADYLSGKTKKKPEPMTGYIYCTQGDYIGRISNKYVGKVVAKFTLREVEEIHRVGVFEGNPSIDAFATNTKTYAELLDESCLKETEMDEYLASAKKTVGYAWYISDLVIFDKTKELCSFIKMGCLEEAIHYIETCPLAELFQRDMPEGFKKYVIKKAPQSWCYVEENG